MTIRPAQESDVCAIFDISNSPEMRAVSFISDLISWDSHKEWFERKLKSPSCLFFVAEDAGRVLGQIRLEREGDEWKVSISVRTDEHAKGIGRALLDHLFMNVVEPRKISSVHAYIRKSNTASIRFFSRNGFRMSDEFEMKDIEAVRMERSRNAQ